MIKKVRNCAFVLFIALLISNCHSGTNIPVQKEGSDSAATADDGFKEIFDGKTLDGWKGDSIHWKAEDGNLVGEVTPNTTIKTNTFIIWQNGQPKDFELKLDFKITEGGNSGVNYRSEMFEDIPFALKGYQADIDGKNIYTGQNYEERGRTTLAYRGQITTLPSTSGASVDNAWNAVIVDASLGNVDSLKALIKSDDWNSCHLIIKGNHLQHYINDVLMSDVTDNDTTHRKMSGLLGMQVHVGSPMKVQYRNIRIKNL